MPVNNKSSVNKRYKDLDLTMVLHPINRDVNRLFDVNSVLRSCKHLVLLDAYEKPFRPEIGVGLKKWLFEPMDVITASEIGYAVQNTLNLHEPRAKILNVNTKANFKDNSWEMTIELEILGIPIPQTLSLTLKRLR